MAAELLPRPGLGALRHGSTRARGLLLKSVAMNESAVYRPHNEPAAEAGLQAFLPDRSAARDAGLPGEGKARRFEIVSRGDFVPGALCVPEGGDGKPHPLLLVPHGSVRDPNAPLDAAALEGWIRAGFAIALVDLPLYGVRSSPKLSERLRSGVQAAARGAELDLDTGALVEEFSRQSTSDLIRTVDALGALPEIDADRIGFIGFGVGAVTGSYLLAHDTRVKAAVLAHAGGGQGPKALDAATYLAKASHTSLLLVASEGDSQVAASAAQRLFEAAPDPKRFERYPGSSSSLPAAAWEEIGAFLTDALNPAR